jgi:putative transposase
MKVRGLLLDRHAGGVERRDGRIAVDERNAAGAPTFEIGCDNGERVRSPSRSTAVIARP